MITQSRFKVFEINCKDCWVQFCWRSYYLLRLCPFILKQKICKVFDLVSTLLPRYLKIFFIRFTKFAGPGFLIYQPNARKLH